jgi:hypothetical protein
MNLGPFEYEGRILTTATYSVKEKISSEGKEGSREIGSG